MAFAIDVSHWTGEVSTERLVCLKRSGINRVIVGLGRHELARRQLALAVSAGFEVEAYVYLYFRGDVEARIEYAHKKVLKESEVQRIWLDCEDTTSGLSVTAIRGRIQAAITKAQALGYSVGIYTGRWWWVPYTGATEMFAHLPLWDADYDRYPTTGGFTRYGGWEKRAVKQYRKDVYVCGIWCNQDFYEDDAIYSPEWDELQALRVYRATATGAATVERLPAEGGKHGWTVRIPRNTQHNEDRTGRR